MGPNPLTVKTEKERKGKEGGKEGKQAPQWTEVGRLHSEICCAATVGGEGEKSLHNSSTLRHGFVGLIEDAWLLLVVVVRGGQCERWRLDGIVSLESRREQCSRRIGGA